jgi:gliding motility-associated-like protein
LTVVDDNGCTASGQVSVRILSALAIPNAFTPNGDGKNDIFYVLGGPPGSIVKDLSIYNRWGQRIFLATDATPGDPRGGWDGRINGTYAMPGTYIYLIDIRLANGKLETYRGALELIR